MNDIARLLTPITQGTVPFPPDSRYHGAPMKLATLLDGREVRYVGRRFTPAPETIEVSTVHTVRGGDRLDLLAAQYFGNPTQGWKILDANLIREPGTALANTGSRIAIGQALNLTGQGFG
jgi:hypothetical protein